MTLVIAGHVTAADPATDDGRALSLADVICSDRAGGWLDDFPGCLVVVTYRGDRLQAATRVGHVSLQGDPVIGGIFLYGWLTAGYPIAHLEGRTIESSGVAPRQWPASFWILIEDLRVAGTLPLPRVRRVRCTWQEPLSDTP